MKTTNYVETVDELRNILIHEDVSLILNITDLDFHLDGDDKFSADLLSPERVMNWITRELKDLGIIIRVNFK